MPEAKNYRYSIKPTGYGPYPFKRHGPQHVYRTECILHKEMVTI